MPMTKEDGSWIASDSLYLAQSGLSTQSVRLMALSSLAGACFCQFQYPLHGSLLYDDMINFYFLLGM